MWQRQGGREGSNFTKVKEGQVRQLLICAALDITYFDRIKKLRRKVKQKLIA
jgi:hypothetical protein